MGRGNIEGKRYLQQLFYNGIRALKKRRRKCISVEGKYVEK